MTRIIIADDHPVVRKGIVQLLADEYSQATIREVGAAEQLLAAVADEAWDLVICDISMPGKSGIEVLRQVKHLRPELPVIIMSVSPQEDYAVRALSAGAMAYLEKNTIHANLINAVSLALQGRRYIGNDTAEMLAEQLHTPISALPHQSLSNRELELFKALAIGGTVSKIAKKLSLAASTISTHRMRILKKMGMHSNAEMTRYALDHGLTGEFRRATVC